MNRAPLEKVLVVGAGTMGSGIAAHLVNLGLKVTLADLTAETAVNGMEKCKSASPPHFMVHEAAAHVSTIGLDSLEEAASDADWVCEAVIEKLQPKRELFARLSDVIKPDALISTNTSGLQIESISEGLPQDMRERLVGAHFFNPPRYLKLVELITTSSTKPEVTKCFIETLEYQVGKRVVLAKDTPGFIANRFGMWCLFQAIHTANALDLTVEETDAITGAFIGRPRSGTFRLADIIGLDVMNDIASNLLARCQDDPYIYALKTPSSVESLLNLNWIGAKSGQGYYRKEGKSLLSLDLKRLSYRPYQEAKFSFIESTQKVPTAERIVSSLQLGDQVGEFLRLHLIPALAYAHAIRSEISFSPLDFDRVMKWGFGWKLGPFELIDIIGAEKCGIQSKPFYQGKTFLENNGQSYAPFPNEPRYITLESLPKLESKSTVDIYDGGDGIHVLAITSKMGAITPQVCKDLEASINESAATGFVLTSNQSSFSVGYDLKVFNHAIESGDFEAIEADLVLLQKLGELLESKDTVAALHGYALGGGLELAMSCSRIVAHSEAKIGLPESRVGLLPGGRGTTILRTRFQQSAKEAANAAITLTLGHIQDNALIALQAGYLKESDAIEFNQDHVLAAAIDLAKTTPTQEKLQWRPIEGPLAGMVDQNLAQRKLKGDISAHDVLIGESIKQVFAKSTSYEDSLDKERKLFLDLCKNALTLARIKAMLENGKPLRN